MAYTAHGADMAVDPADALFMRAVEVAYKLDATHHRKLTAKAEVETDERLPGLRGLLGATQRVMNWPAGWDLGTYNQAGAGLKRLMLGREGNIYFTDEASVKTGHEQILLRGATILDHCHFRHNSFAENVLRILESFAARML